MHKSRNFSYPSRNTLYVDEPLLAYYNFAINEAVIIRMSVFDSETRPLLHSKWQVSLGLLCDPLHAWIVECLIGNHSEAIATLPSGPALGASRAAPGYALDDLLVDSSRSSLLVRLAVEAMSEVVIMWCSFAIDGFAPVPSRWISGWGAQFGRTLQGWSLTSNAT